MKRYKDLNGNSGVSAYEIGSDFIVIEFVDGEQYLYNYLKPGADAVETMKKLAEEGKGLATFINKYVRNNYAAKLNF